MDVLNVVAIVFVVFLHVRIVYWSYDTASSLWWFENLVSGLGVAAVPIFFMLTGAKLLNFLERESITRFYKKRLTKIVLPLIIWGQVYLWVHMFHFFKKAPSFEQMFRLFFNPDKLAPQVWFVEVLVGIYLVMPLFALMLKGVQSTGISEQKFLWYLVGLGSILPIFFQTLQRIPEIIVFPNLGSPVTGYLCFIFLGYALFKLDLTPIQRSVIYGLGVIGFAVFVWATPALRSINPKLATTTNDYLSLPTLAIAAAIFTACKYFKPFNAPPTQVQTFLRGLSAQTFGVFLVHYELIYLFVSRSRPAVIGTDIFYTVFIVAVSISTVYLLRIIPFVRRWVLP